TSAVPTCEASGHSAGTAGSRCSAGSLPPFSAGQNCALVHACSPSAAEGETVIPAGSVIFRFFSAGVPGVFTELVCGTLRFIAIPVGSSACEVPPSAGALGLNSSCGWNCSDSQPSMNEDATGAPRVGGWWEAASGPDGPLPKPSTAAKKPGSFHE